MRSILGWVALMSSLSSYVMSDSSPEHSDVLDLTSSNFQSVVDPAPLILVEFMAPWCGHCKALLPEYNRAATILKERSIPLAKVDCTADADLCSAQQIQGYPSLKVFVKGVPSDYNGPRKADGIVTYMNKRALPVVSIVTPANHTEFSQSDQVVVIAYLDMSDTASLETFQQYAETKRDDYVFGVNQDPSLIKEVSSLPKPSVVLWKKFDEGRNDFHGEKLTVENLAQFVKANAVPLLDEVSPTNFPLYAEAGLPLAYLFIEANNPQRESLVKSIEPVAKEYKGKINFVWIDADKFGDHAKSLGLSAVSWPSFVIQDINAQTKFPLDSKKTVNHDHVAEFVKAFVDGKITPSLKSQSIPAKQGPGSYVLVAEGFDQVVYAENNQKDVFIEFYAPWCGHCKSLKNIWERLALSFKGSADKILIAKMDATENDVPSSSGIIVQGFPTLKFKPAGSKEFIDYEGDRSFDSLIEFVEKHSVNKVEAVRVEPPEEIEYGTGSEQVVLDNEEPSATGEAEDDKDAEHDEL